MTLQLSNFPHDYVWPDDDLSVIPDWVYTDQAIYEREVERIFHGPTWNYVALEAEIPNAGDFIRSNVGPTPIVVTRSGAISSRRTASAATALPTHSAMSVIRPSRRSTDR